MCGGCEHGVICVAHETRMCGRSFRAKRRGRCAVCKRATSASRHELACVCVCVCVGVGVGAREAHTARRGSPPPPTEASRPVINTQRPHLPTPRRRLRRRQRALSSLQRPDKWVIVRHATHASVSCFCHLRARARSRKNIDTHTHHTPPLPLPPPPPTPPTPPTPACMQPTQTASAVRKNHYIQQRIKPITNYYNSIRKRKKKLLPNICT